MANMQAVVTPHGFHCSSSSVAADWVDVRHVRESTASRIAELRTHTGGHKWQHAAALTVGLTIGASHTLRRRVTLAATRARSERESRSPATSEALQSLKEHASAAAATFLACLLQCTPVSAAQVNEEVTGFADYAAKGGAMEVNPACFVTDCGKQTKECFVDDARCLKGALCLSRCRGAPDCATQCFAEFGCKKLDAWLNCTVETKLCVSTPPQLIDVKKWFSENLPKKMANFNPAELEGTWYKVRGYNPKYDCYACQTNSFEYKAGAPEMLADVQLRLPRLKSGGYWQNQLEEKMKISAESEPSTFSTRGEIFGLTFDEDWYVLGGDKDFWLVAYKGKNLQDVYEGAYVYARSSDITGEVEKKARKLAEANGYTWSKFCVIDNTCPKIEAVKDEDARLDLDDIPDLIEWFAPGTVPKKAEFTGRYD
mmetsp:Transcript_42321/g.76776  ORF Transcript_42321/g.76776 Transcript_42321/m.76776 type:complete len:427 (-) Transcript_42321:107-1387(-)